MAGGTGNSAGTIGGRVAAGPGVRCRVERGHRLRAAVLLIQRDVVARQNDPVEGDEEPDGGGCCTEDQARLGQFRAGNCRGRCGVPAARRHA